MRRKEVSKKEIRKRRRKGVGRKEMRKEKKKDDEGLEKNGKMKKVRKTEKTKKQKINELFTANNMKMRN